MVIRFNSFVVGVFVLVLSLGAGTVLPVISYAQDSAMVHRADRQIIIKLKNESVLKTQLSQTLAADGVSSKAQSVMPIDGIKMVKALSSKRQGTLSNKSLGRQAVPQNNSMWLVVEPAVLGADRNALIKKLKSTPDIEYAVADGIMRTLDVPNDPSFTEQWGLNNTGQSNGVADVDIDAPEAWDITTGSSEVVVAVIDTGIQYNHPDLVSNIWVNPGEAGVLANNGIDDDNNGYIDDVHGIDCANNDGDPLDDGAQQHGTHVSGIVGAKGNNNTLVSGVAPDVKIMALKYLNANGVGFISNAIECMAYALDMRQNGINLMVTNNSYGGGQANQAFLDMIELHADADILFVAAAGNDRLNIDLSPQYPASYNVDNVVPVANVTRTGAIASSSSYGQNLVDLGAPGSDILSTINVSGVGVKSGTSMAAPHVAGVAALLASQDQTRNYESIKALMLETVQPLVSLEGRTLTGGMVNAHAALTCTPDQAVVTVNQDSTKDLIRLNQSLPIVVTLRACGDSVLNENIIVTPNNGQVSFALNDNNDGSYSFDWQALIAGPVTLTIDVQGQLFTIETHVVEIPSYRLDSSHLYQWQDISEDGTDVGLANSDDGEVEVDIGFDFQFFGFAYQNLYVHSNGMLKFAEPLNFTFYQEIESGISFEPNNFIAALWDDLNPSASAGRIYSKLIGVAPNRRFIVQWDKLLHFREISEDLPSTVTFQAILYEGSNDIVVQYKDVVFGLAEFDNGASALTSIEGFTGEDALEYDVPSGLKLTNEKALLYTFTQENERTINLISPQNGTVQVNGLDCGLDCFLRLPLDTPVSLTAINDVGYLFESWSGAACANQGSICHFTLNENQTIEALFDVVPAIELSGITNLITSESGLKARFQVNLNRPANDNVVIEFTSSDTSEGILVENTITITPEQGSDLQTVEILGVDDPDMDGDIAFSITSAATQSNDSRFSGLAVATISVLNRDNDSDSDGDGVFDDVDNCRHQQNADQLDNDGDQSGDICDYDDDNDGINDLQDECPFIKGDCASAQETDSLCFPIKSAANKVVLICL